MNKKPRILGWEKTVGEFTWRPATPRIIGEDNVAAFKRLLGVCPIAGCSKIAGHASNCSPSSTSS